MLSKKSREDIFGAGVLVFLILLYFNIIKVEIGAKVIFYFFCAIIVLMIINGIYKNIKAK